MQVLPVPDSDADELTDLAAELHAQLLTVDGTTVTQLADETPPVGVKGLGVVAGWLVAQFGTLDGLRALVAAIREFSSRTDRTVDISIGGDHLVVTGVTSQEQRKITDAWLARHGLGD